MKSIPFGMLKCSIFLKLTPSSGAYLTHSFHIHNLSPLLKDYPASIHLIKIPKFLFPGRPFLGFPSCNPWCFVLSLTMRMPLDMICISLWCCSLMLSLANCMMFLLAIWYGNLPWQSKAHPWSVSCDWTWCCSQEGCDPLYSLRSLACLCPIFLYNVNRSTTTIVLELWSRLLAEETNLCLKG